MIHARCSAFPSPSRAAAAEQFCCVARKKRPPLAQNDGRRTFLAVFVAWWRTEWGTQREYQRWTSKGPTYALSDRQTRFRCFARLDSRRLRLQRGGRWLGANARLHERGQH